jgi:hypothetical protein
MRTPPRQLLRWVTVRFGGTLCVVPTEKPRYQVTDTGEVEELLDLAARRWPAVRDRKALLVQLMRAGAAELVDDRDRAEAEARRAAQLAALVASRERVDAVGLLGDEAWR